jgi:DNA adenine methylase
MSYTGSKAQAGVFQRIIGQMPPHSTYVEAFFGSGQVFWRKRRAAASIVIDRVPGLLAKADAETGVRAMCGDAISLLRALHENDDLRPDTVIYCDPPYLLETRQGRLYYEFELSSDDHSRLLALLQALPYRILLSGYPSELYGAALRDWRCLSYRTRTRGRTVTECLWCNFPEPAELHDWRYVGRNFRERLSLKRLAARWLARLERMPARKRGYLMHAVCMAQPQCCGHPTPEKQCERRWEKRELV